MLVGDDVYGGTFRIFDKVMKQFGVGATFLDMSDPAKVRAALRPSDEARLDGDAVQPDAQDLRHRRDRRGGAEGRGPARGRQHVRDPDAPAAARPRRDARRPLDDQVPERPLRRRRRRGRDERRRARRAAALPPEVGRRGAEPVRLLPGAARAEDARRAHAAARRERALARRVARGAPAGGARALPRAARRTRGTRWRSSR